jgi:hypothetical protein
MLLLRMLKALITAAESLVAIRTTLDKIYLLLAQNHRPTGFHISIERNEELMNLKIFDDGKGVTFTATPDKPLKSDEIPTWSQTQGPEGALVLAPSADGLTCVGTLPNPPIDATGVVVTITCKLDNGNTITKDADPIDIVPNDEATGFTIQESAN